MRAFQEILEDFEERFPDHFGLRKLRLEEGDVQPLLRMIDNRQRLVNLVRTQYDQGHLPIAAFSRLVGRSLFEVWGGLVADPESPVLASRGDDQQQNSDLRLAVESGAVTLDLTALWTVGYIVDLSDFRQGICITVPDR